MDIYELNKKLNTFPWNCIDNDTLKPMEDTRENWITRYKILTPKQFLKIKSGCCWDFVNFEYAYFKRWLPQYKVDCYYIEVNKDETHTWLSIDEYTIFESSWKDHVGIHKFESIRQMLDTYTELFLLSCDNKNDVAIYKYIPIDKVTVEEFQRYIYTKGEKIV